MKAEAVMDELMDLRQTVSRLHDPDIICAEVGENTRTRIHLHVSGDPTEIVRDIGLGLIDVDDDWDPAWTRYSINDSNGVEVYWLKMKEAPDAATSGAPEENKMETTAAEIISQGNEEVKEAHHEINH